MNRSKYLEERRSTSIKQVLYKSSFVQGVNYNFPTNVSSSMGVDTIKVVAFKVNNNTVLVKTAVEPCTLRYVEEYGRVVNTLTYSELPSTIRLTSDILLDISNKNPL